MVSSINDKIRSDLLKNKSDYEVFLYLKFLEADVREELLRLFISDYYKIAYYKHIYTKDEEELLEIDDNMDNITLLDNYEFIMIAINNSAVFENLSIIGKLIVMDHMKDYEQEQTLQEISQLYLLDKLVYNVDYNLDSFKEYYKDYIEKDELNDSSGETAVLYIAQHAMELKDIDYIKYKEFIIEFIKTYYKWKLYIKDKGFSNLLSNKDLMYLKKITAYPLDKLIKLCDKDTDFFVNIVGEFLYYNTKEIELDKEDVDKHLVLNTDEEFQKKLKIKRDFK